MTMFSLILLMLSAIMMNLSNPMSVMLIILIQSVNIAMIIWMMNKTAWFSYLLFLIFLGGLMVLFVYITSLASNEKFNPSWKENYSTTIKIMILVSVLFMLWPWNLSKSAPLINMLTLITLNFSNNMITPIMLVMVYLLITLIVVVKISSKIKGPLRLMTKK
nr:NADH dehydrogenase subunit 6 [Cyphoderus sp.]